MIRYYQTYKGYIATDDTVKLHSNHSSVGNTLVFGRGPTVDWDTSSITDEVFSPKSLGEEIEAANVPEDWRNALGFVAVKSPVKTRKFVSNSGFPNLSIQEVEKNRGPDQAASFLMFACGVFVGLVIAYFIT